MKQKSLGGFHRAMLHRECGEILGAHANRVTLIFAIMVCCTPLMLYLSLDTVLSGVLYPSLGELVLPISQAVYGLLTLFFTLPLWWGVVYLASEMEAGEAPVLADVFHGFSSGRAYAVALRASWSVFWRWAPVFAVWSIVQWLFSELSGGRAWGNVVAGAFSAVFTLVWLFLMLRGFLSLYRIQCDPRSFGLMQPYARSLAISYFAVFALRLLLSLLTVGILLLADTLPRMLIAYFRLCRKLNEKTIRSEETIS